MSLPKDLVKPKTNFTYPSERSYLSDATSTLAVATVYDPTKSGADYGIVDPEMTEVIAGTGSETGKVV